VRELREIAGVVSMGWSGAALVALGLLMSQAMAAESRAVKFDTGTCRRVGNIIVCPQIKKNVYLTVKEFNALKKSDK
jgi:L-serine deaminase